MQKGILVHPQELSYAWIDRAAESGIDVLGLHPVGGPEADKSLRELLVALKTPEMRAMLDYAAQKGLKIEYEMHAASYLLDRNLFASHPECFRMDGSGNRNPDGNFCCSNAAALRLAADNAARLAQQLYRSEHKFYFWLDDIRGMHCRCPQCRELSASDMQLKVVNAFVRQIRTVIPDAQVAYLAYYECMQLPQTVKPAQGVFLEYAPIEKYCPDPNGDGRGAQREYESMEPLIGFFGAENSKVLEYWLDNSLFSNWTKPPKEFHCAPARQIRQELDRYEQLGFESAATFACYLGADYEALYGNPDITDFTRAFRPQDKS